METITEITTEILNDLIAINNDRIMGYEKATEELKGEDADLKALFTDMIAESHQCKMELATEVAASGVDIEEGSTASGKIYRAWLDIKAIFTGHDRKTVLANCEAGEDAAQKAYTTALREDELPAYIRTMISLQKEDLKLAHDKIKYLRDFQA
jgi:uncharacterized protein (TIGR02284 family)